MSDTRIEVTSSLDHVELVALVEKAYNLARSDFNVEYDDDENATIVTDTLLDKHAGLALDVVDKGMTAKLSLFPPINFGIAIDRSTVKDFLLDERKIADEMIDWDTFDKCFSDYENGKIVLQVVVARGIPKEDGVDARCSLHFEIEDKKPKEREDGSVDFKNIKDIVMVEEGDVLITYIKETEGKDGRKVRGEVIPAKKGKKITIHKGAGVAFEDETGIYSAEVGGHVTFNNNKIAVNPLYVVDGDVDYSEGNIDFHGTVKISGDVLSGFEVRGKNIVVYGVARDCTLIATEDVTVRTGIVSTGKGLTKAGNRVQATFIEGAEVHAGVAINIDNYCYNSKLYCEGEILALSGDGVINGGELHAFSSVEAKQIGVERSSAFPIFVGVKYFLNDRVEKLIKQKEHLEETLETTDLRIKALARANPDLKEKEQLKSIIAHRAKLFERYGSIDGEIEDLIKKSIHPMPYIYAKEMMNEGTILTIYNTEYRVPSKGSGKYVFNQNTGHVVLVSGDTSLEYNPKD